MIQRILRMHDTVGPSEKKKRKEKKMFMKILDVTLCVKYLSYLLINFDLVYILNKPILNLSMLSATSVICISIERTLISAALQMFWAYCTLGPRVQWTQACKSLVELLCTYIQTLSARASWGRGAPAGRGVQQVEQQLHLEVDIQSRQLL